MVGNVSSTELAIPMAGTNLPLHFTLTKGVIQFMSLYKEVCQRTDSQNKTVVSEPADRTDCSPTACM